MLNAMRALCAAVLLGLSGLATPALAAERAIIVLDASGSMWAQIDGVPRITIARDTLRGVLGTLPPDLEIGLLAYGHRERGNCADIELLVPPAAGTADAITAAADAVNPLGMTPISDAVQQAAQALRYTEEKATVILITDGLETCDADPCAVGNALEAAGVDFTAHVVGFGLTDEEGRQVACLAENTGGRYFQAGDAAGLTEALTTTVAAVAAPAKPEPAPVPEPEPVQNPDRNLVPTISLAEGGPPSPDYIGLAWNVYRAAEGTTGEVVAYGYDNGWYASLPPGDYILTVALNDVYQEQPVTIEAGEVAEPEFVINAAVLDITARFTAGGGPAREAAINVYGRGDTVVAYGFGTLRALVAAGERRLSGELGNGRVEETLTLSPGEMRSVDLVVGLGRAEVSAFYSEGGEPAGDSTAISILSGRQRLDGTRDQIAYGFGAETAFDLAPGDYLALAELDAATAEVPFTVTAGELASVDISLDAGVLYARAAGASLIEVLPARAGLDGTREALGYAYAEELTTTLPAGDYVVVAHQNGEETGEERPATVRIGERTEVPFD